MCPVTKAIDRWSAAYYNPVQSFCADLGRVASDVGNVPDLVAEGAAESIACAVACGRLSPFVKPLRDAVGSPAAIAAVCRSQVRAIDLEIARLASMPAGSLFEAAVRLAKMDGLGRARSEFADLAYETGQMGPRELV